MVNESSPYLNRTEEIDMFYIRNVPHWERVLRLLVGLAALAFACMNWGVSRLGVGTGVVGAMLAMTGLMGFCPMCALLGRKLDKVQH